VIAAQAWVRTSVRPSWAFVAALPRDLSNWVHPQPSSCPPIAPATRQPSTNTLSGTNRPWRTGTALRMSKSLGAHLEPAGNAREASSDLMEVVRAAPQSEGREWPLVRPTVSRSRPAPCALGRRSLAQPRENSRGSSRPPMSWHGLTSPSNRSGHTPTPRRQQFQSGVQAFGGESNQEPANAARRGGFHGHLPGVGGDHSGLPAGTAH